MDNKYIYDIFIYDVVTRAYARENAASRHDDF